MNPRSEEVQRRVVAPVAKSLGERASELAAALRDQLLSELPELYVDDDAAEAQRASLEASLRTVSDVLAESIAVDEIELPPETVAYARDGARRGVPMGTLMRTYRLAQAALWDQLAPALAAHAADRDELEIAIELCLPRVFGYVDKALLLAESAYATERERFARSAAAVRSETIAAILDARATDATLAGQRLGYDLARLHLGAWAWLDRASPAGDAHAMLEAAIGELARAVAGTGVLLHPLGLYAVAGWIALPDGSSVESAAARLRLPGAQFPGVRLAVGQPAPGLAGFRGTHVEATLARRVATLARRSEGAVTRFAQVELQALVSGDREAARAFVQRQLGALAAEDDTSLRLTATLRAYLDEHASRSRAAKRLGVHENTVSYRIRQAEEILGRSVEEDTLNLRVALAVASVVRDHD